MAEQDIQEIYSLLVPVAGGRILLPRASVAEVVGYLPPEGDEELPDWVLGRVLWNDRRIPLVSFEGCSGQDVPPHTGRDRIIVVFAITDKVPGGYYALLTQGHPHLVRVNAGVLKPVDEEDETREADTVLVRAKMANERPAIPNLEVLERKLARALGVEEESFDEEQVSGDEPTMVAVRNREVDELKVTGFDDEDSGPEDDDAAVDFSDFEVDSDEDEKG